MPTWLSSVTYLSCGMPFEMPQTFFTEHDVRHSFELRKTSLVFIHPGAEADSPYYCDVVISESGFTTRHSEVVW